jgi:hypothetical protein
VLTNAELLDAPAIGSLLLNIVESLERHRG